MNDNSILLKQFAKGRKTELKVGGRAVIYQRVSSKEQEFGFSPETQLEQCYQWAERNQFDVVKEFAGEHESAKSDTTRKRFNEMLKFVKDKSNHIDGVIVYSTSRFSRTGTSSFSIVDELEAKGVTIYSATSNYDARTPDGKMTQGMELILARRQNAINSKSVKDNGARALRNGHWVQAAPIGYDMKTTHTRQTITINEDGKLIREAFLMKANENLTNEEVRVRMKAMGLDLCKQRWSKIFSNIFYAGYFSHPFLEGDIVKGPYEPIVSLEIFFKVNNISQGAHSRGYEQKMDKEYAPLLGSLRCPVCGHNMTASLSTKMRKKYGRDIGYYTCSHKGCKCNVSTKKANGVFEQWLDSVSLPEEYSAVIEAQLKRAFPILNMEEEQALASIKTNLSKKESEIEKVEHNLATAPNAKVQDICARQLEKLEGEKEAIMAELSGRGREILNLNDYVSFGLNMKDNLLKMWQLAALGHKRHLQNFIFPDGIVWSKENDDIEPVSKNEFLFTYGLKSGSYEQKENGQTDFSINLSACAPPRGLEPRTP